MGPAAEVTGIAPAPPVAPRERAIHPRTQKQRVIAQGNRPIAAAHRVEDVPSQVSA
ncbi:MAG: hypothetical protein NTNFB01_12410 [Nitrospira sp.]